MALPKPQTRDKKVWPKHPAGTHQFALADVIVLGRRPKVYQGKTKIEERIALVVQSRKTEPESGQRFLLSAEFTYSTFEGSNLYKFLKPWLGPFPNEAAAEAVITTLDERIGTNLLGTVEHSLARDGSGTVFVNLVSAAPLMEDQVPFAVAEYKRSDYWAKKTARYAEEYAAYLASPPKEAANAEKFPGAAQGLDEFPAALDAGNDEELPY